MFNLGKSASGIGKGTSFGQNKPEPSKFNFGANLNNNSQPASGSQQNNTSQFNFGQNLTQNKPLSNFGQQNSSFTAFQPKPVSNQQSTFGQQNQSQAPQFAPAFAKTNFTSNFTLGASNQNVQNQQQPQQQQQPNQMQNQQQTQNQAPKIDFKSGFQNQQTGFQIGQQNQQTNNQFGQQNQQQTTEKQSPSFPAQSNTNPILSFQPIGTNQPKPASSNTFLQPQPQVNQQQPPLQFNPQSSNSIKQQVPVPEQQKISQPNQILKGQVNLPVQAQNQNLNKNSDQMQIPQTNTMIQWNNNPPRGQAQEMMQKLNQLKQQKEINQKFYLQASQQQDWPFEKEQQQRIEQEKMASFQKHAMSIGESKDLTHSFISQQYKEQTDQQKQQRSQVELQSIYMILKSIQEMSDSKHPHNLFQSYDFLSQYQFKKKEYYFTEEQQKLLPSQSQEAIDMHVQKQGFLTDENVQKKCTTFEDLCFDENKQKVCPTNKEMLTKSTIEDQKQIDAYKKLKSSYDSEPKIQKGLLCQIPQQINGLSHLQQKLSQVTDKMDDRIKELQKSQAKVDPIKQFFDKQYFTQYVKIMKQQQNFTQMAFSIQHQLTILKKLQRQTQDNEPFVPLLSDSNSQQMLQISSRQLSQSNTTAKLENLNMKLRQKSQFQGHQQLKGGETDKLNEEQINLIQLQLTDLWSIINKNKDKMASIKEEINAQVTQSRAIINDYKKGQSNEQL